MAEENNNGAVVETQQGTDAGATGGAEEKKYTDAQVNSISKKNEEKAVAKVLKELGITDREKAKQILAAAAAAESQQSEGPPAASQDDTALTAAREEVISARLENVLLKNHVKAGRVENAVKLINLTECVDDDGKFSKEKADAAVKNLLKDWPELKEKTEETNVGFAIGSNGQNAEGGVKKPDKPAVQKPWNRFNN